MKLTKQEFDDELAYLVSKSIINEMKEKQLINEDEYQKIRLALSKEYKPVISALLEGLPCELK